MTDTQDPQDPAEGTRAGTPPGPPATAPQGHTGPPRRDWVRMRTLFGESVVPPESAAIIMRAVNRAVAVGDVPRNARWMFVEFLAADYLAGQRTERQQAIAAAADAANRSAPPPPHRGIVTTDTPPTQGEEP